MKLDYGKIIYGALLVLVGVAALLLFNSADAADVKKVEAPVYMHTDKEGVMKLVGYYGYEAVEGYSILYCVLEPGDHATLQCVAQAIEEQALVIIDVKATETAT